MKTQYYIIKDKFMDRFYEGNFTLKETLTFLERKDLQATDVMKLLELNMGEGTNFTGYHREKEFWIARAIK